MPDYVYTAQDAIPTTPVRRWEANIEAIKTLKQIEAEARPATPAEQKILALYSGFGDSAFEQAFTRYPHDRSWKPRGEELRDITDEQEYRAIEGSRVNAFYTSREVIKAMWNGLERMGATNLENPRILEPSAGSGRFLGMQPTEMAKRSDRTAVELDSITGRILKHTYPDTKVMISGFEKAPIPDNSIDIAVSNVPFGRVGVHDPTYKGQKFITSRVHNYFFAKTLDKLRPGGVMAFVTSHYTMDAPGTRRLREHLAERADLVGAIRLPNNAFDDTQVVTDIIYLRKRMPGEKPGNADWVDTGKVTLRGRYNDESEHSVNQYFIDNPDAIMGVAKATGSQYGSGEYTVESAAGPPLSDRLPQITRRVVGGAPRMQAYAAPAPSEPADTPSERPEGKFFIGDDGALKQVLRGREGTPALQNKKGEERVRAMMAIRDDARRLLDMERDNAADDAMENLRGTLKGKYADFFGKYGRLNSVTNRSLMSKDPDASFVRALEVNRKDEWHGADLFEKRVVGGTVPPALRSAEDAFAHTFAQSGTLDFERMGQLLGKDPNTIQVALQNQGLIYENPETGRWESADRYLTGRVRAKLESAQLAADADPKYRKNVAALEQVQPEDIPAGDIAVPLGAPWVPAHVLNQWIQDRFQPDTYTRNGYKNNFFRFDETLGNWVPEDKIKASEEKLRTEWGTKHIAANKILEIALEGRPITVTQPNPDDPDKRVTDPEASLAAQKKAEKMQEDFEKWAWEDPKRGEYLAEIYNRTQNDLRPRVFDGDHQTFPGMSADWQKKLRKHQRDAIYRVVQDGTALLAHEVGFGKTAVMVAGGMERKRLGLSRKAAFVVPKATHGQFREQFLEIYPQAKVLFPEPKDFEPKNRREFLARVRTGDWDAIILTMDQFKNIQVRPDTEAAWQELHVEQLRDAFAASLESGDTKSRTHKQIETALKNERTKLADLQADIANMADQRGEYFEDLGIDQIFVDEADNYKNLRYVSKMGEIKGLPNSNSQRAWDMFLKSQYLQGGIKGIDAPGDPDNNQGFARSGVVFATGTPVANTISEAWTMMRYLQNKELHRRGYNHFDNWAKTYGRMTNGMEKTAAGKYKRVSRFANFNNLPELSALFQNVADIRVASEVPQMLEAQPRLVDRKGNAKRIIEQAPTYPSLRQYMDHLEARADKMGEVDPSEDNMLKLSGDARKASLDIRMVEWPFEGRPVPNPNGKIPMAAANVAEVYKEEAPDKGTQIVFLDLATPKGEDKKSKADEQEGDDDTPKGDDLDAEERKIVKDAYNIIKKELIAKGVPEEQIAFIHDFDTKTKQAALFDKVRAGDLRVLVGSTGKLGVGVNVQDRAAAIHHIDVPWRPRDIEQREGRIVRQGNQVYGPVIDDETGAVLNPGKGVKIFNYVQEDSFDEFMWQAVQAKGQAIKSLIKRYVTERTVQDIDPLVLGAAEAKALASGDPRIMRLEELRQKVQTLRLERGAHDSATRNSAVQAQQLVGHVAAQRERLPEIEKDAALAKKAVDAEDKFAMTVGAQSHDKRPDADQAIKKRMAELPFKGDWSKVGEYGGMNVMAANTDTGYQVALVNPATDVMHQSSDIPNLGGANVVTRIDNVLKGIANSAVDLRKKLGQSEDSLAFYQKETAKRFDGSLELRDSEREFRSLQRDIEGVTDDDPQGEAYEVEADTEVSAIINDSEDAAYDTARAKVTGEVMTAMQSGGRDFVMPTQAEIDERIAKELLTQPRAEPARAPEPVSEPAPAAEEVSERVVYETTESDTILEPDAVPAEPVADVESEPAQTPEYAAADPVAVVEPEPVEEPEPVIRWETRRIIPTPGGIVAEPVDEPDAMPADPVADVEAERPSNIVEQFNDRFGDIPWEDRDKILQAIAEEIPAKVAADEAYRNAVTYSDRQNSEIEHSHALQRAVLTYLTTNMELFKLFHDNPAFRDWLTDVNFATTYEQMSHRKNQGKDVTITTDDDPDGMTLEEVRNEASTLSPDSLPAKPEPVAEPDPVATGPVADVESEPAQAPEYAAADPVAVVEPEPVEEPDAMPAEPVAEAEPEPVAPSVSEYEAVFNELEKYPPHLRPDDEAAWRAGLETYPPEVREEARANFLAAKERVQGKAEPEPEPAQEPDYAAADAMAEPEPDTIAEPDTVSGETPAWEPDAVAAETVVAVEPEPAQEPEYAAADPVAEPEPEPESVADVDPVPPEPELERRLQDCEALPIPIAASRVEEYIQQDMDRARSALESAAAYAGLPSVTELPDNVERLELREDGSVVAVIDEDADTTPPVTEPVADRPDEPAPAPDISDAGDAPISPPATAGAGDVDPSAETADPMESDPSVAVQPRWDSMSMAEKAAAIARYNEALENYRKQQELSRLLMDEGANADVVETYCGYLRERLREQKPDGPQIGAFASPKPLAAVNMSQVQLRKTGARQRSGRPGLQPRSRVARLLMGDVQPRQTPTPPVGSVKEAMEKWPSLPQVQFREPERALAPVPVGRSNEVTGKVGGMPESIEYRPGQEPVALGESPDDSMATAPNKRHRRGRRKPDEEENRGAPEINLVVRGA